MSTNDDKAGSQWVVGVAPISGAIGAEIFNVDLANLDDNQVADIRRAWLDHLVIFFRDQNLTPAQLLAFARRIGRPISQFDALRVGRMRQRRPHAADAFAFNQDFRRREHTAGLDFDQTCGM